MTVLDLKEMLTYRRPHRSRSERKFLNRFVRPVLGKVGYTEDSFGNLICQVGKDRRIMFACHTDTVDRRGGRKRVFAGTDGTLRTEASEDCLGADDTTGVWLMLNLIQQGVEGLYIFHRAEEIGCHGSRWIVDNTPEQVEGVNACISLDRKGYGSIVTRQCGMRTASDKFAADLALQLDLGYSADEGGLFTDSMEYAGLIPECTNLSVGYDRQHSSRETQDFGYALALLRALTKLDPDFLIPSRVPGWTEDWQDDPWNGEADEDEQLRKGSSSGWGHSFDPDFPADEWQRTYGGVNWSDIEWED